MDDQAKQYLGNALEDLLKALKEEQETLEKAQPIVASIKNKKLKSAADTSKSAAPKVPGLPNPSKKDPVKVAQQIKEAGTKKVAVDKAKIQKQAYKVSKTPKPGKPVMAPTAPPVPTLLKSDELEATVKKGPPKPASTMPPIGKAHITPLTEMKPLVEKHVDHLKRSGLMDEDNAPMPKPEGTQPKLVHAEEHAIHPRFNAKHQQDLIHGLDLNSGNADQVQQDGVSATRILQHPAGHKLIVKDSDFGGEYNRFLRDHDQQKFGAAKREVVYHNLANDLFGLGDYVPTTAAFKNGDKEMSAMKHIDASHAISHMIPHSSKEPGAFHVSDHFHDTLKGMHDSGDLHKLALMNSIMANQDRHGSNFMVDNKDKKLHLIDNGAAFDYVNHDNHYLPAYIKSAHKAGLDQSGPLHSSASKWLQELSPEKAEALMKEHGFSDTHPATQGMVKKMRALQLAHKDNPDMPLEDLLLHARQSVGPDLDFNRKIKDYIGPQPWHDKDGKK